MFYALGILILGIFLGRLGKKYINKSLLSGLLLLSIFLLLFLLGAAIGANRPLLARLPDLGWQALLIMLCCVGGSILFSALITPFLRSARKDTARGNGANAD